MRIRSTKPEFWRSNTIAQLEWSDRFVLKGLEAYVDDNGVGKDDVELIAADVFPRDLSRNPHETIARLSGAIARLTVAGLVVRYSVSREGVASIREGVASIPVTDFINFRASSGAEIGSQGRDSEKFLYIDKWRDIQRVDRPNKGRFPRPDGTLEYVDVVDRDSYRNTRDTLATGTGEQRNRGTEEKEPPYPPSDEPPPAQPPAKRTNNGAELARTRFTNLPARSPAAHQIAQAFSASLPVPVESGLQAEIATQIDKCLRDSIPPPAIADGLRAWAASDSWHPSQIPKFVMKAAAATARRTNGVGKPTQKAMGYDQLAEELIAEISREEP
jgi:hypothetical protein